MRAEISRVHRRYVGDAFCWAIPLNMEYFSTYFPATLDSIDPIVWNSWGLEAIQEQPFEGRWKMIARPLASSMSNQSYVCFSTAEATKFAGFEDTVVWHNGEVTLDAQYQAYFRKVSTKHERSLQRRQKTSDYL